MTMTINGSGTITGLSAGGLPDASVTNADLSLSANASNVMTALNASGSAPIYACRAWVNFNGTGTVAIRGSGNVSSITDLGVGIYNINMTTAMPDANFAVVGSSRDSGVTQTVTSAAAASSSVAFVNTLYPLDTNYDANQIHVSIFR